MANTTPSINNGDPAVQRQVDRETSVLLTKASISAAPSVSGPIGAASKASASSLNSSLTPVVNGSETVYPQSTATTSTNSVTITSSVNNQEGDVTTVYTSGSRILVNPINQTVNQYTAVDSGVSAIVAGNGISISSTGGNGKGVVTINSQTGNVGNIVTVNLDGNIANVLHGDGSWSADITDYGNSNVAGYLPTYTGSVGATRIQSSGNVDVATDGGLVWTFGNDGALSWPGGIGQIDTNVDVFEIRSTNGLQISTDIANSNLHFDFGTDGVFTAPSNVNLLGSRLNVGPDALNVTTLLNPTLVIANSGAQYIQASIVNTDATGSSDWAAEGTGGSDEEAWADLGFTGYNFSDPDYTITGPGDGYLFVQGYANGIGGHMVLATGDLGAESDIIFATGGFAASDEFARIDHANSLFHLTRTGSGIKFQDGTIQTTAFTGGLGNISSIDLDGNVSNVLRGDGTWGADANSSYGDSNVTSLLGAFGSNAISTTGIITADGANLSNVPYANLTGAPSLGNISSIDLDGNVSNLLAGDGSFVAIPVVPTVGNIATLNLDGNASNLLTGAGTYVSIPVVPTVGNIAVINLDGNASNVLRGDGSWGADANSSYGDSNVVTLLGAFGSNAISTTGIITADGANLSNVPYANLTGAPTLGNISTINIDGNASNVLLGSGSFGAVPGLGNIASINLDGNVSNVLVGNGTFVALPVIDANTVVWSAVPASNTSTGTAGQAAYDSGGNLYVCVATDTWAKFTGTLSW